jgi:hypothetical protein
VGERRTALSSIVSLAFQAVLAAADNHQSGVNRIQFALCQQSEQNVMNFSFISGRDSQNNDAKVIGGRVPKNVTEILIVGQ